jgi:2-polyprenyl-3-methyl-5-hydroxy-6-metoxy-1,4-benzoquinol methylase
MATRTSAFTYFCKTCDYWSADLPVDIDSAKEESTNDEFSDEAYIAALGGLRVKNFTRIIHKMKAVNQSTNLSILDVGCATGLFMRVAQAEGYTVTGIEPNKQLFATTQKHGLHVIHDYFPPKLSLGEKFDVIIFNDVFEHIPDTHQILASCYENLKDDGLLILNLPNAGGLIFRFSKVLAALGLYEPWNRLWQVMFRTPHLHYFTFTSLNKLLAQHSLEPLGGKNQIATIEISGFWSRLAVDRSASGILKNCILYLGTLALYPLILLSEKDTFFSIYRRKKS